MRSESLKKAQAKYSKESTKNYHIICHKDNDRDIIEALEQQANKNGYIKELIRRDIKRRK